MRPAQYPKVYQMKRNEITYWTATAIVAAIMLWSAFNFSFNEEMKGGFAHLGLPGWFRIELTVAKILGALALLIPMTPTRIKEFAYFGFALTIVSASIAHLSSGDGIWHGLEPLVALGVLAVSYLYYDKLRQISTSRPLASRSLVKTGIHREFPTLEERPQ
jgi:hypothetical protein